MQNCGTWLQYSQLLALPYFDIICSHVIDHLFEGSAKTFVKLLLDSKLIDIPVVSNKNKALISPMKIGQLTTKIEANYSGFSTDQWRNWCIIYSPIVLKDAIPPRIYAIWVHFVNACHLLCRRALPLNK